MKSLFLLLTIFIPLSALGAAAKERDAHYWNSLIGKGINLGNALDAPQEGKWGVTLKEEYFEVIAKAGFDSIRLPVRWSNHTSKTAPYTIDPEFLARVDWAIEQALSNNLVIILNIHHFDEFYALPEENLERFLALWKQIALHYKDSPATLYFEILNEPHKKLTSELWNSYLKQALSIIRLSNPDRAVVVGPAHWNSISHLKTLQLPEQDRNLIVTFHFYLPFNFTHQGASWVGEQSEKWLGNKWIGSASEKKELVAHFDEAQQWAHKHQRPIYMGEFGAYSRADTASRIRWMTFVKNEAQTRKFSWAYWEFCASFGLYDPKTQSWRDPLLKALINKK
ncbi:MAG: glycoside hydrolase family 5 protein [Verrucomicrobiales bacterium]|nr:glycoside hydrolase family 5 protein [Verrucomicrobiales bacterium]